MPCLPCINQSLSCLSAQTSAQCASTEEGLASVVVPTLKKVAPKASFFKSKASKNGSSSAGRATSAALSPIRIADKDELADRMKARMKKSVSRLLCLSPILLPRLTPPTAFWRWCSNTIAECGRVIHGLS